jgi:hypothetical protein
MDPVKVTVEGGVLTFFWTKEISGEAQQIVTNLPFIIQHDKKSESSGGASSGPSFWL